MRTMPFEQAAAAMYAALVCANQECRRIDQSFRDETGALRAWLPIQCLDSLWTLRLSWDGTPGGEEPRGDSNSTETVTYDSIVRRFATALAGMRASAPPVNVRLGHEDYARVLGWEVLRSTMRKVRVSLREIEGLMVATRSRRDRMPLLVHETGEAMHLLESVRELWETTGEGRPESVTSSSSSFSSTMRTPWSGASTTTSEGRYGGGGVDI
jgi:hypothetical protein